MAKAQQLIGRFYFKQTRNGNLIGEFSNNFANEIYTESADLNPKYIKEEVPFIGHYLSTWNESGKQINAELVIGPNYEKDSKNIFFGMESGKKPTYSGEGILCDNFLIGDYGFTKDRPK